MNQPETWRQLYPFESHFLDLDGLRLHYLDEGSGRPVVMLHGNPSWSFLYRDAVCALRDLRRVIVPDHIGCGLSDKPQDYAYRLENHIANLERLLDSLGIDCCDLVLHDWGGAIGMGYATRHPERIGRIVVLNTSAFLSSRCPFRIRMCRWPLFGSLAVRGFNAFAGAATRMAVVNPLPPAVRAGFVHPYGNWADRIATHHFVLDIPLAPSHPTWKTMVEIEEKLALFADRPMLICWGGRDFCFNDSFYEGWKQRFPDAECHYFADAGHYVLEDAGKEILPLMQAFFSAD